MLEISIPQRLRSAPAAYPHKVNKISPESQLSPGNRILAFSQAQTRHFRIRQRTARLRARFSGGGANAQAFRVAGLPKVF